MVEYTLPDGRASLVTLIHQIAPASLEAGGDLMTFAFALITRRLNDLYGIPADFLGEPIGSERGFGYNSGRGLPRLLAIREGRMSVVRVCCHLGQTFHALLFQTSARRQSVRVNKSTLQG